MAKPSQPSLPNFQRPQEDFTLKETAPNIGGGRGRSTAPTSAFDLVEQMFFLYVKIEKARNLPENSNPYVEVRLGNYKGTTKHFDKTANPEWGQVFAFSRERIQATAVEIMLINKASPADQMLGRVILSVADAPKRVPPDSQLASQWYRLEGGRKGAESKGELMLAVWMGTQADDAYSMAWHSDSVSTNVENLINTQSKIYQSPRLWYLRVNVIEAQDMVLRDRSRTPEVLVEVRLGNGGFRLTTGISESRSVNPIWNEDIVFVVAEPLDEILFVNVIDRVAADKGHILGRCMVPVKEVVKRIDAAPAPNKWYNLERSEKADGATNEVKICSKLHMRVSLDGGYHVLDEPIHYASDLRATAKLLWKPSIGVLELGILNAYGLLPMKAKENRTDAYCVAKYGPKWVRTRTATNTLAPKWNEQYMWEVYDPCTVLTIGVFDNCNMQEGVEGIDARIGKVRIRLSTLETNRVYTHSYPLVALQPSGVKKMGEIQLVVRFSYLSLSNMLHTYTQPLLPRMHYILPLSICQQENLRYQCTRILCERLERAEPKLRREVVHYMLDVDSHVWSLRKAKTNFVRIAALLNGIVTLCKLFDYIRNWKKPGITVSVHIVFLVVLFFPECILPAIFFGLIGIGLWRYRKRPRHPPHMDTKLSHAYAVTSDDLEEEFDSFPSQASGEVLRRRYDRLRHITGKFQEVIGDMATQGERLQSLLSWRDPRATALFMVFCFVAGIVLYIIPCSVSLVILVFHSLRHPRFRFVLPSLPQNFLRRMPARTDSLL